MIKSLQLRNFQVHRKFRVDLDPNITVIRGRTDSGKSSVLRALRWLCLNNLVGEGFIRHGAKFVYVTVEVGDKLASFKIVRKRGKSNIYKLDGKVFRSFGNKVPDPIAAVLAVNEINFQKQHDSPFWFSASAPEVSRQLNRVIDLSVIDASLSKAAAAVRTARERIAVSEERLAEKRTQYELLEKTETRRVEAFKILKGAYEQLTDTEAAYDRLAGVVNQFSQYPLEALERRVQAAGRLLEEAEKLIQVSKYAETLGRILSLSGALERLARELPDFQPVERAWTLYAKLEDERTSLAFLVSPLVRNARLFHDENRRAEKIQKQLAKERCPLCGRKNQ